MNPSGLPVCTRCRAPLPSTFFNSGGFHPCPACEAQVFVEVFPAQFRPATQGRAAESVIVAGESTCFYHESKKAAGVCDACGRFLCALCDCELRGRHFCPGCLETGRRKQTIGDLETVRTLYARRALFLSLVPLLITGLIALVIALKWRNAPDSLVAPRQWMMPLALVLSILQTVGLSILILIGIFT
jgi:hypothetical protein